MVTQFLDVLKPSFPNSMFSAGKEKDNYNHPRAKNMIYF